MTETVSAVLVGLAGLVVAFLSVAYLATLRE
jgi:hypothetical protein